MPQDFSRINDTSGQNGQQPSIHQNYQVKAGEPGVTQHHLGVCYAHGYGVVKDEAKAVECWRKAAEQGLAWSQHSLGLCYANGQGVAKDEAEAAKWFCKAAEQGFVDAQYNLGNCYYNGQGVTQDYAEAVKWYRKAAEQGYVEAQYNLSVCYANGKGVSRDEAEAVKWYRKAAEQGFALAQYHLGLCYGEGAGVAKDYAEAVKWLCKAAEQGDAEAKKILKSVRHISPEEKYRAQQEALNHAVRKCAIDMIEKYRAQQKEEQKQDNPVEPPSPEVDKRRLRRWALVTHMLIVVSIFTFCMDVNKKRRWRTWDDDLNDLFKKIFDNPFSFFLFAATVVSVFFLFLRAWRMLKQGWRLNYPVYLKRLPVIVPFTILLSFGLIVVSAATELGMFRLGFLLVYWIPGGIFLVHFINSLEKKS